MHRFLCFISFLPLVIVGAAVAYAAYALNVLLDTFAESGNRLAIAGDDGGSGFWSNTPFEGWGGGRHEAGVSRRSAARNV